VETVDIVIALKALASLAALVGLGRTASGGRRDRR